MRHSLTLRVLEPLPPEHALTAPRVQLEPSPNARYAQPEQRDAERVFRPASRVALAVPNCEAEKERRAQSRERKGEPLGEQAKQRDFAQRKRDFLERFAALKSFIVHRAPTSTAGTKRSRSSLLRQALLG